VGAGRPADRLFDAVIIQRDDDTTITNCTAGVGIGSRVCFRVLSAPVRGWAGQTVTRGTCTGWLRFLARWSWVVPGGGWEHSMCIFCFLGGWRPFSFRCHV
jgi:hypothetical protein